MTGHPRTDLTYALLFGALAAVLAYGMVWGAVGGGRALWRRVRARAAAGASGAGQSGARTGTWPADARGVHSDDPRSPGEPNVPTG